MHKARVVVTWRITSIANDEKIGRNWCLDNAVSPRHWHSLAPRRLGIDTVFCYRVVEIRFDAFLVAEFIGIIGRVNDMRIIDVIDVLWPQWLTLLHLREHWMYTCTCPFASMRAWTRAYYDAHCCECDVIVNVLLLRFRGVMPYQWRGSSMYLNLLRHDLRGPVGSLSRFNLSLPQCNVPGVLNCVSGRLSWFHSLYWRYLCISYENYNYWKNPKFNMSSNIGLRQKVLGKFLLPPS